jgi:hypothetical protein
MKSIIKKLHFIVLIFLIEMTSFTQPGQSMSKTERRIVKTLYQQRSNLKLCYEEGEEKFHNFNEFKKDIVLFYLEDGQYLVQVLCHSTAYQGVYEYYLSQPKILRPLVFDSVDSNLETRDKLLKTRPLVGIPDYDTNTQSLIIWSKARGIGDCGSWAKYTWNDSQFFLVEYREKSDCDGVFIEPNNYPLVYP